MSRRPRTILSKEATRSSTPAHWPPQPPSMVKGLPLAAPQLGSCASSRRARRFLAARHSQDGEAQPLGSQPPVDPSGRQRLAGPDGSRCADARPPEGRAWRSRTGALRLRRPAAVRGLPVGERGVVEKTPGVARIDMASAAPPADWAVACRSSGQEPDGDRGLRRGSWPEPESAPPCSRIGADVGERRQRHAGLCGPGRSHHRREVERARVSVRVRIRVSVRV